MNEIVILGTLFTFLSGVISAIVIRNKIKIENQSIFQPLFWLILFLNLTWYSALLIENSNAIIFSASNPNIELIKTILFFTSLFVMRILFFASFFIVFDNILSLQFFKKFQKTINITGIVILLIWFIGWLEVFILNKNNIVENFMTYTDILIFVIIILSCIYLLNRAKSITDNTTKKSIRVLTLILLIPLISGHLKWLLTTTIGDLNETLEKLFLQIFLFSINILIVWWVLFYGNKLKIPILFSKTENKFDSPDLKAKYSITKREMEIIELICEGQTNKEIAEKLFISIDTVKDHNYNIFRKTSVKNRTQLANLFLNKD